MSKKDNETNNTAAQDNKSIHNNKTKGGLRHKLIWLVTVPILFMGIVTMIVSYIFDYNTVSKEVEMGLKNIAIATKFTYEDIFSNQIKFTDNGDGTYTVDSDNIPLATDSTYIKNIKESTDIDVSVIYYDIRLLTTLEDKAGRVLLGTVVSKRVVDDLIATGQPVFYDKLMVYDENYYACYIPVFNKSGEFKGMIFAGKPTADVKHEVLLSVMPIIIVSLIMMLLGALIGSMEARKLAEVINKEKNFLGQIAGGNLRANFDADILKRPDEIGEMGKFMVHVQRFIRDMIERDTLTKLYTRRIGETKMQNTRMGLVEDGIKYQIAMADIDYFKKFNDTYGHDCGDLVLQTVAGVLNRSMIGKGYAVRWGGEEFIIVFENMTFEMANELLIKIRETVINEVVEYKGEYLSITMTFGIVPGSADELDDIIKKADKLLYIGKEGGRNRIIRYDQMDITTVTDDEDTNVEKKAHETSDVQAGSASEEDRLDALMRNI